MGPVLFIAISGDDFREVDVELSPSDPWTCKRETLCDNCEYLK